MAEQTYTIKPLEWIEIANGLTADNPHGGYYVAYCRNGEAGWWHDRCSPVATQTLEAARAACEAHYLARIREVLAEVKHG